jgi:hypothetical protein
VLLKHGAIRTPASFDDSDLVSLAGPGAGYATGAAVRPGGPGRQHVRPGGPCGVNADLKVACLVAGMAAGADSIDVMDVLRHGAMAELFGGIRAGVWGWQGHRHRSAR